MLRIVRYMWRHIMVDVHQPKGTYKCPRCSRLMDGSAVFVNHDEGGVHYKCAMEDCAGIVEHHSKLSYYALTGHLKDVSHAHDYSDGDGDDAA